MWRKPLMAERIQSQVWRCLPDIPILERLEYWELEASLGCTVKSCIKRTQKKQRSQLLWCTSSFPCLLHTIPGLGLEVCSSESHWPAMFKRMVSAQRKTQITKSMHPVVGSLKTQKYRIPCLQNGFCVYMDKADSYYTALWAGTGACNLKDASWA